jgi:hypothetical protein
MIVSHQHEFIFLKTFKTAGTSIEIALSQYCGPDDIITPILGADEAIRRELGYRGPQHLIVPYSAYGARDWARRIVHRTRLCYREHMRAPEVRRYVGPRVWDRYLKFTVERSPWDKVISAYYWRHRNVPPPWEPLHEWVVSDRAHVRGFEVYSIDGRVAVDRVLRYESLPEDLAEVAAQIGLPGPLRLPEAKRDTRHDRRHYREVLDDAARTAIASEYAREIALMGYEF